MFWSPRIVRPLTRADVAETIELLARHPVENVYLAARIIETNLERARGAVLAYAPQGRIEAACWSLANVVPSFGSDESARAFAGRIRRNQHRFSSIFGPAEQVAVLWEEVRAFWRPPSDVRPHQLLMAMGPREPILATPDPRVRPAVLDELDGVLPAAESMFLEEIGYPPYRDAAGKLAYRNANWGLIARGHTLLLVEGGQVVFKAEFGAVALGACQVQGVWVHPDRRGEGIAVPAMAAVVEYARAHVAPLVTLYVNDYNVAAVRTYERVGFRSTGEFMTVLL